MEGQGPLDLGAVPHQPWYLNDSEHAAKDLMRLLLQLRVPE
jgi:hypothetical protein